MAAGSIDRIVLDSVSGIALTITFSWSEGVWDTQTKKSSSVITMQLVSYNEFGGYDFQGNFHGTAIWVTPMQFTYNISFRVKSKNSDQTEAISIFNPIIVNDMGCI